MFWRMVKVLGLSSSSDLICSSLVFQDTETPITSRRSPPKEKKHFSLSFFNFFVLSNDTCLSHNRLILTFVESATSFLSFFLHSEQHHIAVSLVATTVSNATTNYWEDITKQRRQKVRSQDKPPSDPRARVYPKVPKLKHLATSA